MPFQLVSLLNVKELFAADANPAVSGDTASRMDHSRCVAYKFITKNL